MNSVFINSLGTEYPNHISFYLILEMGRRKKVHRILDFSSSAFLNMAHIFVELLLGTLISAFLTFPKCWKNNNIDHKLLLKRLI